ncbi:MAG: beta-phosphoglucomutase [Flavobacteriaceae bacterium]|jgi:beta-phosphoglucomutase
MLKAVLFDMDGVIVDSELLHQRAYQKMFKEFEINVSPELYASFTGKATLPICQDICLAYNLKASPEELMDSKRMYFKQIFNEDTSFSLLDGVLALIQEYRKKELKLVLASSASMININRIFKRFNLDQYFTSKLSGADLKASKPHPEIFIKAAKVTGFLPSECVVIEDSTNGITAAKAAGIFCVGYNSKHSKNQEYGDADLVITNFKEISFDKITAFFQEA